MLYTDFFVYFTFIMYQERQCFIYVGMNTNTCEYEDIAFRSWECIHTCIDFFKNVDGASIVI